MPFPVEQLAKGRYYQTPQGEVRMIVSFDGESIFYVVERNGVCPVWNKAKWVRTRRSVFAQEISREIAHR